MTDALACEREGLLRDICENPSEDGPRLVFADWLEDQGGDPERVEFIRLQHANPLPFPPPDAVHGDYYPLRWRHLWACHAHRWLGLPTRHDSHSELRFLNSSLSQWRCGFVEEVRLPLAAWTEHGPALVRQHPLRKVELSTWGPHQRDNGGEGFLCLTRHHQCRDGLWIAILRQSGRQNPADSLWITRIEFHPPEVGLEGIAMMMSDACLAWAWPVDPVASRA